MRSVQWAQAIDLSWRSEHPRTQEVEYLRLWGISVAKGNIAKPKVNASRLVRGVGTHLNLLLKEFGISADLCGSGCGSFAAAMDQWGVDGCRQNRDKIKERLLQKYKETTWMTSVNAAFQSVWSGNVFKMDILHPVDWLIDEAIRRAEDEACGGNEKPAA